MDKIERKKERKKEEQPNAFLLRQFVNLGKSSILDDKPLIPHGVNDILS